MGLAERRAVKAFQDAKYPELKRAIDTAAGYAVDVEVKWDSLAVDNAAHLYDDAFTKIYFQPVITALKNICIDDMGRSALKAGLKKIVICNESEYYGTHALSFENGILKIDHLPATNIDDVVERTQGLTKLLEKSL